MVMEMQKDSRYAKYASQVTRTRCVRKNAWVSILQLLLPVVWWSRRHSLYPHTRTPKKPDLPKISLGDKVKVTIYLELPKEVDEGEKKGKERIQLFEGIVISQHLASTKIDSTITVRKMFQGGGVEKVFVLNSPWIKSLEVIGNSIVRRSKLYYLRDRTGKSARLKRRLL